MMNKSQHTPGPWLHVHQTASDYSHDIMAVNEQGPPTLIATCGCQVCIDGHVFANAEFIVRACNAHDELLATCKKVEAITAEMTINGREATFGLRLYETVHAAIAKAEGGES